MKIEEFLPPDHIMTAGYPLSIVTKDGPMIANKKIETSILQPQEMDFATTMTTTTTKNKFSIKLPYHSFQIIMQ